MRTLIGLAFLVSATAGAAADKPVIRTESDLPQVRFPVSAPPSAMLGTAAFVAMLPKLRAEAERLLRDYAIQDSTITQRLLLGLADVAVLEGRAADAGRLLAEFRAGEAKPQRKLLGGYETDLAIAMMQAAPDQRCTAAATRLSASVAEADPAVIRDQFLHSFAEIQEASTPFFAGGAVGVVDPIAKQRGSIDVLWGMAMARWQVAATALPTCRDALVTAGRTWVDASANRAVDIWPARQPAAAAFARATPVVVAVWDRGFDVTLFPGQLARDPAEPLDGRDNDGDGVVDDVNGPTYDVRLQPRDGAMAKPTRFLQDRLAAQMAYDKGELDLNYGFDTPEAALFASFVRTASAVEQGDELLASFENSGRNHGTACASEIADDAPYVRLYNVAALPWGRGEDKLDVPYDEATIARWAAAIGVIGRRMQGAHVRVVSMSWGLTADEITQQLLDRGLETDPARARTRGLAMRQTIADALHRMMLASPEILFVVAAGNSNQPGDIEADAVKTFSVPNLLIVGATGSSGRPTAFTVFGDSVPIYAQGEAVRLRWPGDIVVHESGTSMAAPLVARAAAQMLAVQPALSAMQVRAGLLATATEGESGLKLLHPASAVAWAAAH